MTPPWRSPTPEPPQQARSSHGQNGTVRACACPHLKPPPVLVRERGQAPALTLHPVPSRWSLSSTFAACPERSGSDTSPPPQLRLYRSTPPPLLATHHSTPPPRTRRRAEARSGRPLAVAPTRGLRRSPQASCRSPGPLELKQLLGQGLGGLLELPGPRQALGAASSHRLPPLRRTPSATEACELDCDQLRPPFAKPRVRAGAPRAPLPIYPSSLAPNPLVAGMSSGEAPPPL